MILVVGGTGFLGGLIADTLIAKGENVRALVRPQSDGTRLERAGAEIAAGDLKAPASLEAACRGVDVVITTANSALRGGDDNTDSVDHQGNISLIDAAEKAGVRQFVFVSASTVDPASPVPLFAAKARAEQHLRASGMDWTIIAPHIFMDVWFPMIVGGAVRQGRPIPVVGGGRRRHSFIAAQDVAAFTVAAVRHPAAKNQRLLIGGPAPMSWTDVVATSSEIVGRTLAVDSLQPGQPIPGLPSPHDQQIGFMMAGLEQQDVIIDTREAAQTFGVTLTPAANVLRRML